MSKFRARALDTSKYMPIFRSDEIPDLPDFAAINRSVPQMPTGMEKDEECEHHLQRAMSAQQSFGHTGDIVIPTPEVFQASEDLYNELYPDNYKFPRQLIHVQPFSIEHDTPDYDMDSEDEIWLNKQKGVINLSEDKFEEMMDRLEKSSGQHVLTLKDAKALLKEDEDLIISVYDYWLNKRLKTQQALIYLVKTERRDGTSNNNPYVAFRRRTEKMQTRKNRKNDEASYEKMLKLKRDLTRAVKILQLVKERETAKQEHLRCTVDIFEKRYHIGDYNGQILAEVSALRHIKPSSTYLPINNIQMLKHIDKNRHKVDELPRKKREYRKRHKQDQVNVQRTQIETAEQHELGYSSDDEILNGVSSPLASDQEEEDPDGPYAFKRKKGCSYHAPLTEQLGNWPWCESSEGGAADKRFRFCLTSVSHPNPRCIGYARRRIGRGGRIIFDRVWTPYEDYWSQLDYRNNQNDELIHNFVHFRPKTPPQNLNESDIEDTEVQTTYDEDGNEIPVVPIRSFSDYLNESEIYSSTKACLTPQTPSASSSSTYSDLDISNFRTHQEQLFEMQRKQLERLKRQSDNLSNTNSSNNNDLITHKMCNHDYEHSSLCNNTIGAIVSSSTSASNSHLQSFSSSLTSPSSAIIVTASNANLFCNPSSHTTIATSSTATIPPVTTTTTKPTLIPQASTLDPARVQLAVSAVLSASEVTGILNSLTNGPVKENNEPPSQQSNAQKDQLTTNMYLLNCQNSKDLTKSESTLPPTDVT